MPSLVGVEPLPHAQALEMLESEQYLKGAALPLHPLREIWTEEYIDALSAYIRSRKLSPIMEICAGDGRLGWYLNQQETGLDVLVTDDDSWRIQHIYPVIVRDAAEAIEAWRPEMVIASWAEPGLVYDESFSKIKEVIEIGQPAGIAPPGWEAVALEDITSEQLCAAQMPPFVREGKQIAEFTPDGVVSCEPREIVRSRTVSYRRKG